MRYFILSREAADRVNGVVASLSYVFRSHQFLHTSLATCQPVANLCEADQNLFCLADDRTSAKKYATFTCDN